jgi:hypothetical protein
MNSHLLKLIAVLALGFAAQAEGQERAGVVTTLEGTVTVTRASLSQPAPLKFKDDIFVKDRIATGANAVARILLGGRAVVTVREHSVVTITELPGVSTVDVAAGRAAVAVARERMRPGDLVEVKTPNAVAGIRGTVIVAEVKDADHSVITVLKGVIDVKRIDSGQVLGNATIVSALQRVAVVSGAPVPPPQMIAPDSAKQLGQEFRVAPPRTTPPAVAAAVNDAEVDRASRYLAAIAAASVTDRAARKSVPDDDQDAASGDSEGRGSTRRDEAAAEKADKQDRGRNRDRTADALSTARSGGRSAGVSNLGEALKGDRGNKKNKDRDR